MKNIKKIAICTAIILMICCLFLGYRIFIRTETVIIPWMPVTDVHKEIDTYVSLGYCTGGYATEDGLGAIIQLSERQKQKWLKKLSSDLEMYMQRANQVDYIQFATTADKKELMLCIDRTVNFETLAQHCGLIAWTIEKIQILNADNNWGFKFIVKDMKTEEILYEADFPQDSIKLDASIWDEQK